MIACLDPGHGYDTPGKRSPDGSFLEYEFNQDVADRAEKLLQASGVKVVVTKRMKDKDVPLSKRCEIANKAGAKVFISIHANAAGNSWSSARGFEVYHFPGSQPGRKLAEIGLKYCAMKLKTKNRGVKSANFAVLRGTRMPAILFEFGFFTNKEECQMLKTSAYRQACAEVVAMTVCEWLGVKYKGQSAVSPSQPKTSAPSTPKTDNFYRVFLNGKQVGAFLNADNAYKKGLELFKLGNKDVYVLTPKGEKHYFDKSENAQKPPANPVQTPVVTNGTPILGKPKLTAEHLDAFVRRVNPQAPPVAEYYIEIGKQLGIRGDIAFCQAIKETNYFRFGGDVKPEQNNFCGLGAVGGGAKGASFPTPRQGVRAHLEHLWAYATTDPLPDGETPIDPRFALVKRGSAKTWEELAGKWAVPGYDTKKYKSLEEAMKNKDAYGHQILKIFEEMKKFKPPVPTPKPEDGAELIQVEKPTSPMTAVVTPTIVEINGKALSGVIINSRGYVRVTEIAELFGYKALYDTVEKKIIFVKG